MTVDLRSDTLTKPTEGMLQAMIKAPLGDDVWGEDPSVIALEHEMATLFGMEAGLFCPSGTMGNQIALKTHTQPGQSLICDEFSHIYQYESGAYALLSGLSLNLLKGDRGRLNADQIGEAINPDDIHKAPTRLVVLENTCNKGGGSVYRLDEARNISALCKSRGLALHMDGARMFNALVSSGASAKDWGAVCDSISISLSKGLGCPVGSVLIGSSAFIRQARRWRKIFGGGMRQAGIIAAAGLYALEHHIERLEDDHRRASQLGDCIRNKAWCREIYEVETNIVLFTLNPSHQANAFCAALSSGGVQALDLGPDLVRLVTHLDVDDGGIDMALNVLNRIP